MSGCILSLKSKGTCLIFTEEMDFKEQKQTPKHVTFPMHHVPSCLFRIVTGKIKVVYNT